MVGSVLAPLYRAKAIKFITEESKFDSFCGFCSELGRVIQSQDAQGRVQLDQQYMKENKKTDFNLEHYLWTC